MKSTRMKNHHSTNCLSSVGQIWLQHVLSLIQRHWLQWSYQYQLHHWFWAEIHLWPFKVGTCTPKCWWWTRYPRHVQLTLITITHSGHMENYQWMLTDNGYWYRWRSWWIEVVEKLLFEFWWFRSKYCQGSTRHLRLSCGVVEVEGSIAWKLDQPCGCL